jgi:hypothetical protein
MRILLLAFMVAAAAFAAPASAAPRQVPYGWLGVTVDGPMLDGAMLEEEWDLMAASGVETVRAAFYWRELQPSPGALDLTRSDAVVIAAAARGMGVLPVVHGAPGWAADNPFDAASRPRDADDYAKLLAALVERYGPSGSLWAERPDLPRVPIRHWQLWNEPNLTRYWAEQPFAERYVALLRRAHGAVRRADPGAKVILAGLPNESWTALRSIYKAGGRGTFDAVALHPYTGKPANVIRLLEYARREMRRARDGKRPLWVTELSWPAALGKVDAPDGFVVSERGQSHRIRTSLPLLARERRRLRIERVLWYTWLSADRDSPNAFSYSGLRRMRDAGPVSTRSLGAFRDVARMLQGCVKARADARRCR